MPGSQAAAQRSVRLRIEGLVQGVGFRSFVAREATALGLAGWVRNRRDGGVETVARGATDAVATFIERCRKGPTAAAVAMVRDFDEPVLCSDGFEIRPTV